MHDGLHRGSLGHRLAEARVSVGADGDNCGEANDQSAKPERSIRASSSPKPLGCHPLSGAHDTDCPQLAVRACLRLEGYEVIDSRTLAISWKCRNVDEYFLAPLGGRNEAKSPVIIPLHQSAMCSHREGPVPGQADPQRKQVRIGWISILCGGCSQSARDHGATMPAVGNNDTSEHSLQMLSPTCRSGR